jgi:hypothetical protein
MRISSEVPTLLEEKGVTLPYRTAGRTRTNCITECLNDKDLFAYVGSHSCTQCKHFVWRDMDAQEVRCIAGI